MKLEHTSATAAEWDAYVADAAGGSIFHTAWWHAAWEHPHQISVLRAPDGAVRAGMLLGFQQIAGRLVMRRPPLTSVNDPLYDVNAVARYSRYTQHHQLLGALLDGLPAMRLHDFMLGPDPDGYLLPYLWRRFDISIGASYVIPHAERDTWREGIAKDHRRALKRGRAELDERRATITTSATFAEVLPVLLETARLRRFSPGGSPEQLKRWWRAVEQRRAGEIYAILDPDGQVLCTELVVADRHRFHGLASGMRTELRRQSHLGVLLIERMITDAHARGLDLDFEGSSLPGVEEFVRRWGGVMQVRHRALRFASPLDRASWRIARSLRDSRALRPGQRR